MNRDLRKALLCWRLAVDPAAPDGEKLNAALAGIRIVLPILEVMAENESHPPQVTATKRETTKAVRRIRSRFSGRCRCCGEPYAEGEVIAWCAGEGATHEECSSYWINRSEAA